MKLKLITLILLLKYCALNSQLHLNCFATCFNQNHACFKPNRGEDYQTKNCNNDDSPISNWNVFILYFPSKLEIGLEETDKQDWLIPFKSTYESVRNNVWHQTSIVYSSGCGHMKSSLHMLILGFLYALFVQWSILVTIKKPSLSSTQSCIL